MPEFIELRAHLCAKIKEMVAGQREFQQALTTSGGVAQDRGNGSARAAERARRRGGGPFG